MTELVCVDCEKPVRWSWFLDTWWCADCRHDDCREVEDE